jgi:hypothetical protein
MENSVVISVNTIPERDLMIKDLYKTLTTNTDRQYTIQKDRVNRIKIFHIKGNLRILINTYIVVILPVLLDFSPLENVYGTVDFRLDATIDRLIKLTHKLQSIQGKRVVEGKVGAEGLKKALINIF